jgi:hypothetical protein
MNFVKRSLWPCLFVSALICQAAPGPVMPRVQLAENQGFCPGMPAWSSFQEVPKPEGIQLWTSTCEGAAQGQAVAISSPFRAPAHLTLYLLGWKNPASQALRLENLRTSASLMLRFEEVPDAGWQRLTFGVPDAWRGEAVRLRVETPRSGDGNWVGFLSIFFSPSLSRFAVRSTRFPFCCSSGWPLPDSRPISPSGCGS